MPQKSTYFYPKLTSGLLLFPSVRAGSLSRHDRLAGAVPRGGRRREGRARGDADAARSASGRSARARAATSPPRSTRPPRRAVLEALRPRRRPDRLGGDRHQGRGPLHGRRRPDRRLAERRARRSRTSPLASRSPRATTMDDVFFGFVYDFGANEEWTAVRGGGAFLNGEPITGGPKDYIEFLSLEATRADARARGAARSSRRSPTACAIMGAQAITFCHLAAGRTDAVGVPEAVALGRLRRLPARRARARLRIDAIDGPAARDDPARPHGPVADLRGPDAGARRANCRGATLLASCLSHATPFWPHSRTSSIPSCGSPSPSSTWSGPSRSPAARLPSRSRSPSPAARCATRSRTRWRARWARSRASRRFGSSST